MRPVACRLVRDQLPRSRASNAILLVSGGLAISGIALTIGALGARAVFGRGSAFAVGFVATVVVLMSVAAGCAVPPAVTRMLSGQQSEPRKVPVARP